MNIRLWGRVAAGPFAATVLVAALAAPGVATPRNTPSDAPVVGADRPGVIRDRYIVVFDTVSSRTDRQQARAQASRDGAQIHYDYETALKGFAATLPPKALEGLSRNRHVDYIEADATVSLTTTQSPATWGLDRIDQRALPLNNAYNYTPTGSGVTVYVIDSGIRFSHSQFAGGRAVTGYDAIDGGSADDCNGHGTHVAGTVGGSTYGVAKAARLVGVRVLDCSGNGSYSGVIAGVDWVTGNHAAGAPAAANMSLGGPTSSSLDTAINNSINDGVTYAVAAGNDGAVACNYSPARIAAAITVGSTTSNDARSSFSNYGTCLDLFAPGSNIVSASYASDTGTATMSGTSMASPHLAGIAALYLETNTAAAPATVRNAIVAAATANVVSSAGSGSPNVLAYSLLSGTPTPTTTTTAPATTTTTAPATTTTTTTAPATTTTAPATTTTTAPATTTTTAPSGCTLPESFTGTLSGTNDYDYHPNGNYYYSSVSGVHSECLGSVDG